MNAETDGKKKGGGGYAGGETWPARSLAFKERVPKLP